MNIHIPDEIKTALDNGAALVSSVSGGKDSDAMSYELSKLRDYHGWSGRFILIHADVGRMEWAQSLEHCEKLATRLNAEFVVVKHSKRDLLDSIKLRMVNRPDAPPFPSPKNRQCTSDFKRAPIDKWIRNEFPENQDVIIAMGLRADESAARAKKSTCQPRTKAAAVTKNRNVWDWLPIHNYTTEMVWETIGLSMAELELFQALYRDNRENTDYVRNLISRFPAHVAYLFGNERVSCSLCIMGSLNDLKNGAEHQTSTYVNLCWIEMASGYSFQQQRWLGSIRPDLLPAELREWYQVEGII